MKTTITTSTTQKPILIVGSSGHAKVIVDILERENRYVIAGYIDSFKTPGEEVMGYKVLGTEDDVPSLVKTMGLYGFIVAIGDNWNRQMMARKIASLAPEIVLVSATHPDSSIGRDVSIGEGTVVMARAVVNANSSIGRLCIINTKASLGHDCSMQDHSSLAPNTTTGGNCHIGEYSAICISATLKHRISVGQHSVVGSGSLVLHDIPPYTLAYGIPRALSEAGKSEPNISSVGHGLGKYTKDVRKERNDLRQDALGIPSSTRTICDKAFSTA